MGTTRIQFRQTTRDDCEISSEAKIDLPRLYQRAEKVQNRPLLDSEFRNSA